MKIEILRTIGKRLLKEIPLLKQRPLTQTAIGVGAAGDKTYQIDKIAEDIILSGLDDSGDELTIVFEEIGIKDIKGGGKKVL